MRFLYPIPGAVALVVMLLLPSMILSFAPPALADLMIIGNDEKIVFDAEGNRAVAAPGKDTVSIVDITDREARRRSSSASR